MPTHSLTHTITAKTIADLWARLKAQGPRVHCITNSVVQNLTANTLLAVGAVPSMSTDAAEIVDFSRSAHALLVNLGTLDAERRHAIATAIPVMAESGKAWVLDPVMIDSAPHRLAYARDLLALTPAIIRANQAEMDALGPHHGVLAISGVKDSVKTTQGRITLSHGHAYGSMITGGGCALSAIMAALTAVNDNPALAAATGFAAYGIAQDIAAREAEGPGSFAVRLLDELANLTPERLAYDLSIRIEDYP
ncbi:MAG: hydroxyethylthiazole kinase [Rhizobiales bacterium]|nr:hydroxyethylthiazole kinase [Hyphomicrobiales bacterium]